MSRAKIIVLFLAVIFGFAPIAGAVRTQTVNAGDGLVITGPSIAIDFTRVNVWTGLQTFGNASSTVFSATTICFTGDTCRTSWPTGGGGTGNVATGTPDVLGQVAIFGSTSATPATIIGTSTLFWNNTAGRLGIGTNAPTTDIQVSKPNAGGQIGVVTNSTSTLTLFSLTDTNTSGGSANLYLTPTNSANSNIVSIPNSAGFQLGTGLINGFWFNVRAAAPIVFANGGNAFSNEKMRISATGLLGIGTTSPYKLLSVGGDAVIGAATAGGTLGDLYLPKLGTAAGSFVAVDPTGKVIATSTPAGGGGVSGVTATYPLFSSGGGTPNITTALSTTTLRQTYGTAQGGDLSIATSSDTNILLNVSNTAGAFTFAPSFTGTLAAGRLNSNVVQAVTNDTNVTGSISAQNLTLGWTGTLADGRIASAATWNAKESALTFTTGLNRSTNTITCLTASASVFGCLAAADYSKFNSATTTAGTGLTYSGNAFNVNTTQSIAKLSNLTSNGLVKTSGSDGTLSIATAGTDFENPLTFSTGLTRSVNAVTCDTASGSVKGCLSAADWTTFNGKQASGNYITALTGDVAASGPGSAAATLATVNSNVGAFTLSNITANAKGLVTAAASYAGTSCTNQFVRSLNGAGVATCNTVSLTADVTGTLAIGNGGTGLSSIGASSTVLVSNGTSASWQLPSSGGASFSGTLGQVEYFSGTNTAIGTSTLFIAGNSAVGIGTTTPWGMLSIKASAANPYGLVITDRYDSSVFTVYTASTTGNIFEVATSTGTINFAVDQDGHLVTGGSAPTVATCGTTPSVSGNDTAGTITITSATACTVTFAKSYASQPRCVIIDSSGTIDSGVTAQSSSAFTASFSGSLTGWFNYICPR